MSFKVVCISDTHNKTGSLNLPPGDLLIHSGDATMSGSLNEVIKFNKWLGEIKDNYKYGILFIPGNHDWLFEKQPDVAISMMYNAKVLMHESTEINGYKIFGSPFQPEFCSWAFNIPRGQPLAHKWSVIPLDTQILVTHGPPYQILDRLPFSSERVGCEELSKKINELKDLELHVFGHIHHGSGMHCQDGITYVNASICDEQYKPLNTVQVVDL